VAQLILKLYFEYPNRLMLFDGDGLAATLLMSQQWEAPALLLQTF